MKKLMTMIAAAAMSFGLFADAVMTSFETGQAGVNIPEAGKFTPPTGWTWTGTPAAFDLTASTAQNAAYTGDENVRRDDEFLVNQANYLELKTGTDTLVLTAGVNNVFVDQLVKFTGFEDPQTNLVAGTKIAVWMSEFWNDDETEAETNLYVTCATVDAFGNAETKAFKIDGEFSLDTWYRVTIRNIGDIVANPSVEHPSRAGFIVYINGELKASEDAKGVYYNTLLKGRAQAYNAQGQLFPAIDATDTALNSIGYKGMGAIDDIIVDAEGPAFAQEVTFTLNPDGTLTGFTYVVSNGTAEVALQDGEYTVKKGANVTIYATPVAGKYVAKSYGPTEVSADTTINLTATDFGVGTYPAKVVIDGETTYYLDFTVAVKAAEKATGTSIVVTALDDAQDAEIDDFVATIPENGTITITGDGTAWTVNTITIEGELTGRSITANAAALSDALTVGEGAKLWSEAITLGAYVITLEGSGEVSTETDLVAGTGVITTDTETYEVDDADDGEYDHTYTLKEIVKTGTVIFICGDTLNQTNEWAIGAAVQFPEYETATTIGKGWFNDAGFQDPVADTAAETVAAGEKTYYAKAVAAVARVGDAKFETAAEALVAVQALEAQESFPITVTAVQALTLTVDPQSISLAAGETIEITADSWKFDAFSGNVVLLPGKTIKAKTEAAGATITTIPGYKVVKSDTTDGGGYYTWSVEEAPYFTIGEGTDKYYTAAELKTALAGETAPTVFVHGVMPACPISYATGMTGLTIKAAAAGDGFSGNMSFGGSHPNLVVDGITFKGGNSNHISITGLVDGLFKNCTFKDENGTCNYAVAGDGTTLGARFENCVIDGYYRGFNANFGGETTIVGCTFKNTVAEDRSACQISGATSKYYIENNTFENCAGSAFMIYDNMTTGSVIVINGTTIGANGAKYLLDDERVVSDKDLVGLKFYWGVNSIDASCDQTKAMKKGAIVDKLEEQFVVPAVSFVINLPTGITYADWDGAKFKLPADDATQYTLAQIEAMARGTAFLVKPGYAAPAATAAYTVEPATVANCDFAYQLKTAMYDITFTDAAEWTNVVSMAYGATPAPTVQVPEKAGYTFTGWNPAIVAVEAAATYTAVYTPETYTITYTTGNGAVVTNGVTEYTIETDTFALPVAADIDMTGVTGVEFAGWTNATSETVLTEVQKGTKGNLAFFAKWAAVVPEQKVEPGEEKKYDDPQKAADAAKAINENKEASINVPTEASGDKAAYLARVAAKVLADGLTVVVDIAADKEATFKGELDAEMEKTDVAAALTDATATKATIATVPGFYYWIEGGVEVGTINQNGAAVMGDGSTVELTKPTLEATTKAFYKLAVGVKDPAAE